MANLLDKFDLDGNRNYETGVDHGVHFPYSSEDMKYVFGDVWDGLVNINESPSGAEATPMYADNIKYLNLYSAEEFGATVEAYYSPESFDECDGTSSKSTVEALPANVKVGQQTRKKFALTYRTLIGNDVDGNDHGEKIHIIYNAMASPSEKARATVNDSPEASTLSWELTTTPIPFKGDYKALKPTSHIYFEFIYGNEDDEVMRQKLYDIIYGKDIDDFSASKTYAVGDIVTHEETSVVKYYKCTTAIDTPAEWDSSKWAELSETEKENVMPRLPEPSELFDLLKAETTNKAKAPKMFTAPTTPVNDVKPEKVEKHMK